MATEKASERGKLVSVICRTVGRPELIKALESIASQNYPHIELVLVNATKIDLSAFETLLESLNTVKVYPEQALKRSDAANAGLEAASGDYLMFLDDDDWIDTDHIASLTDYLNTHDEIRAVYSSVQKSNSKGENIPYVFAHDYDPLTLMRDNYIPIHSMLFSRSLLDEGCRFDEEFDIYEDWDFWLQLSRYTNFHHIDKISAHYRQGGDSDTASEDDTQRYNADNKLGKARAAIFEKWKSHWSGKRINQLFGELDQSKLVNDFADKLKGTHKRLEEEYKKSDKLNEIFERSQQELESSRKKIQVRESKLLVTQGKLTEKQLELDTLAHAKKTIEKDLNLNITQLKDQITRSEDQITQLKDQVTRSEDQIMRLRDQSKHLNLHIEQLVHGQQVVLKSLSWKLTSPLRRLRALFTPTKQSSGKFAIEPVNDPASELTDGFESPEQASVAKAIVPTIKADNTKAEHNFWAKAELKKFLASNQMLKLPIPEQAILTIVLVFHNQAHLSLLCLRSLLEFADVPFRLVIVDNNSSDDTPKLLDRIENALIMYNENNLGFVRAVNQAAESIKTEYMLLLNNDAVIEKATLSTAINTIKVDSNVGAVGAKIKLLDGSLQEAGSIIWDDGACLGYGRGQDPMKPEFMFQRDVDYCSGAFLLVRYNDFQKLGAFEEVFAPAYYEESDFCVRLQEQGKRIVYNPQTTITHYEFASSGGIEEASKLQQEHQQIFCNRHPEYLSNKLANNGANSIKARTNNGYPNILVIDDRVPHQSLGSGYPRCAHILNSLCSQNLNVSFYPLQFPVDNWEDVYNTLDPAIEVLLDRGHDGLLPLLQERKNFYKFIMVSRSHNMEFFNGVANEDPNVLESSKVFYDAEAIFAPRDIMKMELLGQTITKDEKQRLLSKELDQARDAGTIITVSKREADLYKRAGYTNTKILGHSLQTELGSKGFDERNGFLFVGALRDEGSPNVDSLLWFVINILPIIEQEIPDIELQVVGDCSAPSLKTIERNNVKFLGRLDSTTKIYNDNRLFIAPTRFAAGIPHKVHEAAAHGVPSVTTALLAKQLGWEHEEQLLVGDRASEFADQCIRLYQNAELWNHVRSAGLRSVSRECSDKKFQTTLKALFS